MYLKFLFPEFHIKKSTPDPYNHMCVLAYIYSHILYIICVNTTKRSKDITVFFPNDPLITVISATRVISIARRISGRYSSYMAYSGFTRLVPRVIFISR